MKLTDIISSPDRWTKNHNARDANNLAANYYDDNATCWCLNGALLKLHFGTKPNITQHGVDVKKLADAIRKLFSDRTQQRFPNTYHVVADGLLVIGFNDDVETTYEDIQKVLAEAQI